MIKRGLSIMLSGAALMSASAASAAELLLLDHNTPGVCLAKVVSLPAQTERALFVTRACPTRIIWDKETRRIYSVENEHLWLRTARQAAGEAGTEVYGPPHNLGPLPAEGAEFWLDRTTRRLQTAYLIPIPQGQYRRSKDGRQIFRFRGQAYSADDFGLPFMAINQEFKNGAWKAVAQAATTAEACDTQGLSVLKRDPLGIGILNLAVPDGCIGGQCPPPL